MDLYYHEVWNGDRWKSLNPKLNYTIANMMEYFMHREASDGNPTSNFKDIPSRAFSSFKAGHIQYVVHKEFDNKPLLKCSCIPDMKKISQN